MQRLTLSASTVVLGLILSGCIGVTPLPRRTRTPQGSTQNIDLQFLKPGQTTREEVLEKLHDSDTGFQSDRFFIGRWSVSKWGAWLIFSLEREPAAGRAWGNMNLLIEFDANGLVKTRETFPDKQLMAKLVPVVQQRQLASEERMDVLRGGQVPAESESLVLSPDGLQIAEFKGKKPRHYKIPPGEISGVTLAPTGPSGPIYTTLDLHFLSNLKRFGGPGGKKLRVQVTIPQLVTILRYTSEHSGRSP